MNGPLAIPDYLILTLYAFAAILLLLYGYNCYFYIYLFLKNKKKQLSEIKSFSRKHRLDFNNVEAVPMVTTQLPIYNERYVATRLIDAVIAMDYPKEKHEIQVLDDSQDDTWEIIETHIEKYREQGFLIEHLRREDRVDFKAGALQWGMKRARGDFLAIFDSDFVPPAHFLLRAIPFIENKPEVGFVQTRWGHLNRSRSLLTKAQAMGIDGHFIIEQSARQWGKLFLNFNGTAGIWRRQAIDDAGGWQGDTLTEDMDLSYRCQLKGWKTYYLPTIVCRAELPEDMNAFKSQQFRWAKGSIQTAKKLLPTIMRQKTSLIRKIQALVHLTQYTVHPYMIITALCALPMLSALRLGKEHPIMIASLGFITFGTIAPSLLYFVSQAFSTKKWPRRVLLLPILMIIGVGIAINNTRAVFSALFGSKGSFIRTPKTGAIDSNEKKQHKVKRSYKMKLNPVFLLELLLGAYCVLTFAIYISQDKWLSAPFLVVFAMGFIGSAWMSLRHQIN